MNIKRRSVLAGLTAVGAALCVPPARAARGEALEATEIATDVLLVRGAGGNLCLVKGTDGVLALDTGAAAHASALRRLARDRFGKLPIRLAVNTHWHPDHTGGNDLLRREGADVLAHENTRLWMGAPIESRWDGLRYAPRPRGAWPTRTFYTTDTVEAAGHTLESGYLLQAHTDGDIYVRLPRANVLVTGDVFTVGAYPVPDPATLGWIGGLVTGTEALLKVADDQTQIVPGTGPVQRKPALQAQAQMLATVRDRLFNLIREGKGVEEMIAAKPTAEFDAQWGDPERFIRASFAGMTAHWRHIPGIV